MATISLRDFFSRQNWRKKLLVVSASLVTLVVLLVFLIGLYIRSERFNQFIISQIKANAVLYGLRVEVGNLGLSLHEGQANLKNIKVFNKKTDHLLLEIQQAELTASVPDAYELKLQRQVVLQHLSLKGLKVFLEFNPDGTSSFTGLETPKDSNSSAIEVNNSQLNIDIADSDFFLKDGINHLTFNLNNLGLKAKLKSATQAEITLTGNNGEISYQDYNTKLGSITVKGQISDKGLQLESSEFITGLGKLRLNGQLNDWKKLEHQIDFQAETQALEIADLKIKGQADIQGKVVGNSDTTHLTGKLNVADLKINKAHITGLQILQLELVTGTALDFVAEKIKTKLANVDTISASNIEIPNLKGSLSNNNLELALPKLLTTNLTVPKGKISGVQLNEVSLKLLDGNLETKVKQILAANVAVPNAKLSSVKLNQVVAQVKGSNYKVETDLALSKAILNNLQVDQTTSKVKLENNLLTVSKLQANLLGGQANLEAQLALSGKTPSHLQTKFQQINSAKLGKLLENDSLPITGLIAGSGELTWPGLDFLQATGELKATAQGQTTTNTNNLPLTAEILMQAQQGKLNIKPLTAKLGETRLSAQATITPKTNTISAQYKIESSKAEELLLLAKSLKLLDEKLLSYNPEISGKLQLVGQINGLLDKPTITSEIQVQNLGFQDNKFQNLAGNLKVTPEDIQVSVNKLSDGQGGNLQFAYQGKLSDPANTGQLKANFDNFHLQLYQADKKEIFVGAINGKAEFTKLGETPEGKAEISLTSSRLASQLVESAKVEIGLANQIVQLNIVSLQVAMAKINGQGSLGLQTKDFTFQGKVNQLDIAKLNTSSDLAGIVDANVQVSGNLDNLNNLQLNLDAESNDLHTSTTQLGRLSVLAKSDSQGRLKAEITSYLIPTQPQKAVLLLSPNQPGYPLEIESEISKLDVAVLLAAFKLQSSGINTNLSGKIVAKGNILNSKGEFSVDNFQGNLLLTSASVKLSEQPLNIETPCNITFGEGKLCLDRMHVFSNGSDIVLSGQLGLNGNNSLDFTSNGTINLAQFSNLVPNSSLAGLVKIDAKLGGTVNKPNISGTLLLNDLGFMRPDLPVELRSGNGLITLQKDKVLLTNFTVRANDGEVSGSGQLSLNGFQPSNVALKLEAKDVNLIYQAASMTLKGNLILEGTPKNQVLRGNIKVVEASYSKPFDASLLNSGGISSVDDGSKSAFSPQLDINIDADSSIIVRNPQINTTASASISLGGKITSPNLSGRISLEGGTVTLRKQRYEITEGVMDLPGGVLLPTVNVRAEGEVNSYRVFIHFTGPIDQIDLALESEPVLTRTEILALITTGRTEVTGGGDNQDLATTGLNTGANLLAQEFISKPFGRKAEQFLGLSQFQVDPIIRANENPSARLTLGRQIIPKLSFTYSTSLATGKDQSIALEYNLSSRFSSLFSFTQGGGTSTKGTISDNVFTFEIRGRERFALGGKGDLSATPALAMVTSYKPFTIPTADVIVDTPKEIKINNDTLRDLLPIKKQAFSIPLTRLGEQNLTNYLQEKGYFFAKVITTCEPFNCQGPDLKVHYQVIPGTRYEVREITITGTNLISAPAVISQLQSKEKNFFGKFPIIGNLPFIGGFADGITSNERLNQDSEFIRQQLVNLGYRQASVVSGYSTDSDGRGLRINFTVTEGVVSKIGEIDLLGTNALTQEELRKVIGINFGDAFSPTLPREAAQKLQDYYAQRGYLDTKIDLDLEQIPDNKIKLIYQIDEGSLATVYDIMFEGTHLINEKSLKRFIDLKQGDPITSKKIQELQKDLYATGNFREIQVLTEPVEGANTTARHVRIKIIEAKPLLLVYGFGFSSDDGPRGSLELSNTDFFNKIVTSSLKLRLSKREQVVQMQVTDLRPFGSRWSSTFSVLYNRISRLAGTSQQISNVDQLSVNTTNIGLSRFLTFLQTEHRVTNHTLVRFRYSYELNKLLNIEDVQFNSFAETSRVTRLAILSAGSSYDTRDNPINPSKGQFFSIDYSLATRFLGGNESFNKINTNYQYYFKPKETLPIPFINKSILAFSSRIGLAAPFDIRSRRGDGIIRDSDSLLPFSERFRSGGSTTLRGFTFETAGPQAVVESGNTPARLVPLGGDALLVFNLELRYPISKRLQLVPFYDLGNVFSRVKDIDFRRMTNTVGLGLRFNTPIGPIGIDYGYLLDPQTFTTSNGGFLRQRQGVIHIKFGQSF